jgi:hypothetical protein
MKAGTRPRQFDMAIVLHQGSRAAAKDLRDAADARARPCCDWPLRDGGPSRIFRGTNDQVAEVRGFVQSQIPGHPALSDAVLAASELAANAIAHTSSGDENGMFLVHVATVSADHLVVLVTDQGGPGQPRGRAAGMDAESGRGLAVVQGLACLLVPFGDDAMRTILAVIGGDNCPGHDNQAREPGAVQRSAGSRGHRNPVMTSRPPRRAPGSGSPNGAVSGQGAS